MFRRFIDFFSSFREGVITLPNGESEVLVMTDRDPKEVWLRVQETGNLAVCAAGVDKFGYEIIPGGFVIFADVQSENVILDWFVWF